MVNTLIRRTSLALLCTVAAILLYSLEAHAAKVVGKATKVEGRADIVRAGQKKAGPIKAGDGVSVGDIIRTKSDGRVELVFIDKTTINIGPKSRFGVSEYVLKDDKSRSAEVKLYRGRARFDISKTNGYGTASKFELKTRTAVAGVRGTKGILVSGVIERVYVFEGLIDFSNRLGTVRIEPGFVGEAHFGRAPTSRTFSEKEYKKQEKQIVPTAEVKHSAANGDAKGTTEPAKEETASQVETRDETTNGQGAIDEPDDAQEPAAAPGPEAGEPETENDGAPEAEVPAVIEEPAPSGENNTGTQEPQIEITDEHIDEPTEEPRQEEPPPVVDIIEINKTRVKINVRFPN